jgi:hypothetical protein
MPVADIAPENWNERLRASVLRMWRRQRAPRRPRRHEEVTLAPCRRGVSTRNRGTSGQPWPRRRPAVRSPSCSTFPGATLTVVELKHVAETVAQHPEIWRPLVDHDAAERRYESLYVDDHLGVWVISWMPGHDTGYHDHDGSRGAVAVLEARSGRSGRSGASRLGASTRTPGSRSASTRRSCTAWSTSRTARS